MNLHRVRENIANPVAAMPNEEQSQSSVNLQVKPPDNFSFKPNEWKSWKQRFERYRSVSKLDKVSEQQQVDMLVYCMGEKAEQILDSFGLKPPELAKYDTVMGKFENYFTPKKNLIYERAKFLKRKQQPSETIEEFVTDLYSLAKTCEWDKLEEQMLLMMVIIGMRDQNLSDRLQLESDLKLETAINTIRKSEELLRQKSELHDPVIDEVRRSNYNGAKQKTFPTNHMKIQGKSNSYGQSNKNNTTNNNSPCVWCGIYPSHRRGLCPAKNASCHVCKRQGHYGKVCKSGRVNTLEFEEHQTTNEPNNYQHDFFIENINEEGPVTGVDPWTITLGFNNNSDKISFKIDTGADVSVLPAIISVCQRKSKFNQPGEYLEEPTGTHFRFLELFNQISHTKTQTATKLSTLRKNLERLYLENLLLKN